MLDSFTQWSSAEPFMSVSAGFVGGDDAVRIAAYSLYEQLYWNIPDSFRLVQRGSDDDPIYIPSGRQIVETLHRYLANELSIIPDPSMGTESEQAESMSALTALMRRERFQSKFSANKRFGIIRGDWLFRIEADPTRPEGSRISLSSIDPAQYYPIYNPENVDEIIGAALASIVMVDGKELVQKTTYMKTTGKGGPSPITVEEGFYKLDKSGLPGTEQGSPEQVTIPPTPLPSPIDQIPIYHVQNFDEPGTIWGSSEMRGLERLSAAINQAISDEELSLALEGLGVYWCDGGSPIDAVTGQAVPWDIGPARVIEVPTGKKFGRVSGITSVTPFQDHLKYLHSQMDKTVGISDVAQGVVDVQVAESGVALYLKLAPLLSRVAEKEQVVTDVSVNMLFDLRRWFTAYEGFNFESVIWLPTYGDKIPSNRQQKFKEIMDLVGVDPPLVSSQWARLELAKLGYEFPPDAELLNQIITERTAIEQVAVDVTGARMDAITAEGDPAITGADPADKW